MRKGFAIFILAFSFLYLFIFLAVYFIGNQIVRGNDQNDLDLSNLQSEYDDTRTFAEFHDELVNVPVKGLDMPLNSNNLADNNNLALGDSPQVLGDETSRDEKRIEIDLTNQKLYAFEGDNKIYEFLVSTGKWGRTPTGEFRIWTKLRYTRMSGGSKALRTYYNLPNVPFTMFFSNNEIPASRGYGIHGTYWHNNFGHPMSHGCINMKNEDVEKIYYWANPVLPEGKASTAANKDNPGTKIVIYGIAPKT